MLSTAFFSSLLLLLPLTSALYTPQRTISGDDFFPSFDFFSGPDPTNGFVSYLSREDAISTSLVALADHSLANNSVYIGVDSTSVLSTSGPGRASVRLHGKEKFTHGLITVDIYHAPTGCGLWPAIWMVDPTGTYPGSTGEIDIFEYVHDSPRNSVTLHTSEGCKITNTTSASSPAPPPSRLRPRADTSSQSQAMSGHTESLNCYVNAPEQTYNKGCSIASPPFVSTPASPGKPNQSQRLPVPPSFATAGQDFNAQNGGMYALLWTSEKIEVYFFPRPMIPEALAIPSDGVTTAEGRSVNPNEWRAQGFSPVAVFEGCDFDAHIKELSLVVNTDFCGDWAGNEGVWEGSGCKAKTGVGSCEEYVAGKPGEFEGAYWLLGGVEVWGES
ncbi:hypothetical protein KVT40_006996 [Elsinoe batatas]|uniref:GH16 domain-containing protein n=1 Tax=Elsinoe batatas TaxID=2601811 RepID=A0A8K0PB14_9PEZI|nr:hypothetical protein KVT40_006996 [Elsinoe batatas]